MMPEYIPTYPFYGDACAKLMLD